MIRPRLLLGLGRDPVSFGVTGEEGDPPTLDGPAVMVVAPVTDALKLVVDGVVSGPIDRERVAIAVSFSVSRDLLERLGDGQFDAAGLIESIRSLGAEWAISNQDDPLRPFNAQ